MFLEATLKRNRALVDFAFDAVRSGQVRPGTYLLDLDTVEGNARLLADAAAASGLRLHFMAKQVARQPDFLKVVARIIPSLVAVNIEDAEAAAAAGVHVGHIGHLVQPGERRTAEALALAPDLMTVFSVEMAKAISHEASRMGRRQDLLARVVDGGDQFFPGQEGGIRLDNFVEFQSEVARLPGVQLVGVTTFPALEIVEGRAVATHNLRTIRRAAADMPGNPIVNAPGHTSVTTIVLLQEFGATEGEPGHSLTGTTPLNVTGNEPETPALVYATEVSHRISDERVAVIGGGFYARGRPVAGLVCSFSGEFRAPLVERPVDSIDYYASLDGAEAAAPGDPVVFAFRTQAFVTRASVAAVVGLKSAKPRIVSVADSHGRAISA